MTKIQLEGYGEIIIAEGTNFPLNFNIQNLTKPESTPSNYSKNITIVGDNNSNSILGHAYDVNVTDSTFDINKKVRCNVIQDDCIVFTDALFQLLKVETSEDAGSGQTKIKYTARVKSSKMSFFTDIKNKNLTDLNIGDTSTFQYLNKANIEASFGLTASSKWKYVPTYKDGTIWKAKDFRPGIFVKTYWDAIHEQNGWEYEFDEISDLNFDKLIIPYTGKYEPSEEAKEKAKVKVDKNTFQQYDFDCSSGTNNVNNADLSFSDPFLVLDNIEQDDFNQYDLTDEEFTANFTSEYTFEYTFDFTHILQNFSSNDVYPYNGVIQSGTYIEYEFEISYQKIDNNGVIQVGSFKLVPSMGSKFERSDVLNPGNNIVNSGVTTVSFTENLIQGEKIRNVKLRQAIYSRTSPLANWAQDDGNATITDICSKLNVDSLKLEVQPELEYNVGSPIYLNDFIPRKVKQSDFIKSFINMYNLIVDIDTDQENKLIYKTRDTYFDEGEEINWTEKIAQDKPKIIEWLVDKQKKERTFTYKQDEDSLNQSYFNATKDVYGEFEYDFGNEYNVGEDKLELIFSPTPTVYNSFSNMYLPSIIVDDDKDINIRLLFDGGEKTNGYWFLENDDGTLNSTNDTNYPHITHFDDAENPSFDLNFGVCEYYFYNNLTITNNNLFNLYHRRYVSQQTKGRIMTAFFKLEPVDILNFKLNSRIFIKDTWWNVNRIIDYNANNSQLTKVELVTVDDGVTIDIDTFNDGDIFRPRPTDPYIAGPINDLIVDNIYNDNTISVGSNVSIVGRNNIIQTGAKGSIIGDNNTSSGKSLIIGDNNTDAGLDNKLVVGNNREADEEYDAVIGDTKIGPNVKVNETTLGDNGLTFDSAYVDDTYILDEYFVEKDASFTFGVKDVGTSSISTIDLIANEINISGDTINISSAIIDGYHFITKKEDFPDSNLGTIQLEDNVTYFITGNIDLEGDRLAGGQNTVILGGSSENCSITSTGLTAGIALFNTSYTTPIRHITFKDVDTALNISGGGTVALDWTGVNFLNVPNIGIISNIDNFIFNKGALLNSQGLIFKGTAGTIGFDNSIFVGDGSSGYLIEIDSTANISRRFRVIYSSFVVFSSSRAINVSTSATIPNEGYILDTVNFSSNGSYIFGVDETSNKSLFINCVGITNTSVNGQMYMTGNATASNILNTTDYVKVEGSTTPSPDNAKYLHTDNRLTNDAIITRKYRITCNLSFESGNNNECFFGFYDSTISDIRVPSRTKATANSGGRAESVSLTCVVEHSQGDYIEIWCRNSSAVNDITVTEMNVVITEFK